MSYLLAIIGIIVILFSLALLSMETPPDSAIFAFMIGVVLTIGGAIVANRSRQKQQSG